jgi:glucose-1-phosphate cytidylyltransferase
MKVVILAGGLGTRLSEETGLRPKPMVEIGEKPILWHIMKIYSSFEIYEFIICCGYKSHVIKEYFANYYLRGSDITFDLADNRFETHKNKSEPWRVTLVDTGEDSGTGGRLKKVKDYLGEDDFCFTYGDGVANVNIHELIAFHKRNKKLATVTAVLPPSKYGVIGLENHLVKTFEEKPEGDGGWINGGFFVLSPKVIDYIDDYGTMWEAAPMKRLAKDGQLSAFLHKGFWHPMDSLRDKRILESIWKSGTAPWRVWE